ncbi:protein mono-ADP-ribosyltransferase PARP12-like [Physella acuta]|uniref:protein mono-ADP-ribosyltransferase PARP12-like n=1 Tax=Physella acuta TaxID=109671 RepID=UPI0027DE9246|nr:protein mono-ADP-ribosyltransferase PARP12-like [Physella acuta]
MDSRNRNMKRPFVQVDFVEKLVDVATDLDSLLKNQVKEDHLKHKAKEEKKSSHLECFSCVRCEKDFMLEKEAIFYRCTECEYEACRFCHQPKQARLNDRHDGCRILHLAGSKCFTDPKIFPANWHSLFSAQIFIVGWQSLGWQCQVELNSLEGQAIIDMFCSTFFRPSNLRSIMRIQNQQLWEKYYLKRKHMVEQIGLDKIKERALFHGTKKENINLICQEGFDIRVPTANGDKCGKGIYFSPYSRFSYHYTGGCKCMIIARVLCGNSTVGSRAMTRPPKDSSGRFYDTTVNNLNWPVKYCVFDNSQCYPAYIIEYSEKTKEKRKECY